MDSGGNGDQGPSIDFRAIRGVHDAKYEHANGDGRQSQPNLWQRIKAEIEQHQNRDASEQLDHCAHACPTGPAANAGNDRDAQTTDERDR